MKRSDPEYPKFKKEFWEWFDCLPDKKKRLFWSYKEDMAEMNFFFTVWEKKKQKSVVDKLSES
jgi:hypothetical protein